VRCFKCGEQGHKKWECKKKEVKKEVALPQNVWKKIREHCGAKGLPPRGAKMSIKG